MACSVDDVARGHAPYVSMDDVSMCDVSHDFCRASREIEPGACVINRRARAEARSAAPWPRARDCSHATCYKFECIGLFSSVRGENKAQCVCDTLLLTT